MEGATFRSAVFYTRHSCCSALKCTSRNTVAPHSPEDCLLRFLVLGFLLLALEKCRSALLFTHTL